MIHWQFTSMNLACSFADMISRVTGDPTRFSRVTQDRYQVERFTGTRWVIA